MQLGRVATDFDDSILVPVLQQLHFPLHLVAERLLPLPRLILHDFPLPPGRLVHTPRLPQTHALINLRIEQAVALHGGDLIRGVLVIQLLGELR
jgi:hypothetical protein